MMTEYLDGTDVDDVLTKWAAGRFGDENARVIFRYGDHEQATVPPDDLVRQQIVLPDGRLLRVDHSSPQRRGDEQIFLTVERPGPAPGPGRG